MRSTRPFRSAQTDSSVKDAEMAHAIRAVKKILDSISDVTTQEQPAIISGKSHVMGFCSNIILDATKEDFMQESQSSSSSSSTNDSSSDESHDGRKSSKRRKIREKRRRKKQETQSKHKKRKHKKAKKSGRKTEVHADTDGSGSESGSDDKDENEISNQMKSIKIQKNHRHKIILDPTSEADGDDEREDTLKKMPEADQPCSSRDAYPPSGGVTGAKRKLSGDVAKEAESRRHFPFPFTKIPYKIRSTKQKRKEKKRAIHQARFFLDDQAREDYTPRNCKDERNKHKIYSSSSRSLTPSTGEETSGGRKNDSFSTVYDSLSSSHAEEEEENKVLQKHSVEGEEEEENDDQQENRNEEANNEEKQGEEEGGTGQKKKKKKKKKEEKEEEEKRKRQEELEEKEKKKEEEKREEEERRKREKREKKRQGRERE